MLAAYLEAEAIGARMEACGLETAREILKRAQIHIALRSEEVRCIEDGEVWFWWCGGDYHALALLGQVAGRLDGA